MEVGAILSPSEMNMYTSISQLCTSTDIKYMAHSYAVRIKGVPMNEGFEVELRFSFSTSYSAIYTGPMRITLNVLNMILSIRSHKYLMSARLQPRPVQIS